MSAIIDGTSASSLSGTLTVTGATTLSSTLAVTGATTLTTALGVASGGTGSGGVGSSAIRSYLAGLGLSNDATDATNDIDIAVGVAIDGTNAYVMSLASILIKRLDAAWAVGTNQGGLDTGAIANTTYHVWLIARSDTGVVDVLFSTSASAPTMPTNYTYKRRIGSIIRSAGTILAFSQLGNEFLLKATVEDVDVTLSTTATFYTLTCPSGIQVNVILNAAPFSSSAQASLYLSSPDVNDQAVGFGGGTAPGSTMATLATGATQTSMSSYAQIRTSTSGQIRAVAGAASTGVRINTSGWIDTRGRDE